MTKRALELWVVALTTIIASCAAPPKSKIDTVYRGLNENLPRLDPGILAGRTILIDPGHGGHFAGTHGQEGLAEAHVNLGVSLYLWGLLREAGAAAHLTRSAERDFLTESDSSLALDLAARVAMVDSLEPDIFVSVHHNAQPERDAGKNATETYYRFGDPASRDLAFAVHRHMMRNLGVGEGEVRPGNYYVLRNIDVPAILGEGSYLTHRETEEKLELSSKQRLEAEAYFLGILDYFSHGTPRLELQEPTDSILTEVPTVVLGVADVGGLGVDPAGVEMELNGRPVDPMLSRDGTTLRYTLPWDAPNGAYTGAASVRNVLGNTSRIERFAFRLEHGAELAAFDAYPQSLPSTGGTIRVRARLLDRRGLVVADGTMVGITASQGTASRMSVVRNGFIEFPVTVPAGTREVTVTLGAGGRSFDLRLSASDAPAPALQKIVFADSTSGTAIDNITIMSGDSLLAEGASTGVYFLPAASRSRFRVRAPGYRRVPGTTMDGWQPDAASDTVWMEPWYSGALHGLRFVLDPEGGFGPGPGMGRLGLSGAFVNLQVARYLEEYLAGAGALVRLTRTTEETLSPRDVVAVTNRFGADRYIEIRHRNAPEDSGLVVSTSHFPGSRTGAAMAADVQTATASYLGFDERAPTEEVTFPLQQTACPAIVVELPSIGDTGEELRLGEPWYQRRQAYGIYLGILRHYGVEDSAALNVVLEADTLRGNWFVTLEDTWSLLTSPDGRAVFRALAPGRYAVELHRGHQRRVEIVDVPAGLSGGEAVTLRVAPPGS